LADIPLSLPTKRFTAHLGNLMKEVLPDT